MKIKGWKKKVTQFLSLVEVINKDS